MSGAEVGRDTLIGMPPWAIVLFYVLTAIAVGVFTWGIVRLLRKYRLELTHPGYTPRYDYGGMAVPVDGMPIVLRPLR